MKVRALLPALFLITTMALAADLPVIPAESIANKKELLFSDDFERADLGKAWGPVVPTYALENGALKGTQTRVNTPAADGKPAVVGHAAVIGTDVATKDSVVEFKFRFAGATALSAEFDDRKFTGSHYGHICRVVVTQKDITLRDERDGSMRNDIYEMSKDPARKDERNKLIKGRSAIFPVQLEADKWYTLVLETVGDTMRATLDGKPVAFLKSSGIAHPTKSKIEFGCAGKDGYFDDIKIWNAEAAKP
ncbi:MAG: signal peptide-domain containing protein [Phycisphaerales bacterium]|nr:signal peptide-domain containing protein [Phycisphaerales bacterium]